MMRKRINWPWLLVGVLVATSTFLFWDGARSDQARFEAEQQQKQSAEAAAVTGAEYVEQVLAACERDDATGQAVREAGLCKTAEDTKESIVDTLDPSTPAPSPAPSAVGPSDSQVLRAVTLLVPPALRDLVFAQLPGTLDAYCALRNGCIYVGKDGQQGPVGPAPSDERLRGLIAPMIPPPIPGAEGPKGDRGRGVASLSNCVAPVALMFDVVFDDGTTQTVSCGPLPDQPEPETPTDPTPEVTP